MIKDYFIRADGSDELECRCGCEKNTFNSATRWKLNNARGIAGIPFIITSGCRCWTHNAKYDKNGTSSHLCEDENKAPKPSYAFDIKFKNSREKFIIIKALIEARFNRIGINDTLGFIHGDDDPAKAENVMFRY